MSHRLALYPGSFDPITNGHLDVLERATRIFDEIEVTVAVNAGKHALFSTDERCELVRQCTSHLENVTVQAFEGLLTDHARRQGAVALIRGLRQVSDFDYEFRMAFANRRLLPEVETVFFMTSEEHAFVSASIVREISLWGGELSSFVPAPVLEALRRRHENAR
jgi:pantetheine-phosphate adenylyltransferase